MNDHRSHRKRLFPTFAWLFRWRHVRVALFIVACLATLIALLYAEENWRGKRAWDRRVQELESRGITLDLASVIPPAVPDSQNFAAHPLVASLFNVVEGKPEMAMAERAILELGKMGEKARPRAGFPHRYDLASEWWAWKGLPFVFALWAQKWYSKW